MELDKVDLEHTEILQDLSHICRSSKTGFTDISRIEAIREELADTEYKETYSQDGVYSLWSKVPIDKLPKDVLIISSHIDTVPEITNCYSELNEETGILHGTYDNMITNTAAVIMMKEHDFPNNVVFAFSGEEETGRMLGAKNVAKLLYPEHRLICVALDVTYEGFDNNSLYTIENFIECGKGAPLGPDKEIALNRLARMLLDMEPDTEQTFTFVKANKRHVPTQLPEKFMSKSSGMCDEAYGYRDEGFVTMSVCIPTDGDMHSNSGLKCKQPVFEGYILSLTSLIYELTNSHKQLIEVYKIARSNLVEKAKEISIPKPQYYYNDDDYDYDDYDDYLDTYYYNKSFGINNDYYVNKNNYDPIMDEDTKLTPEEEENILDLIDEKLIEEVQYYEDDEIDEFLNNIRLRPEYVNCFVDYPYTQSINGKEIPIIEDHLREIFSMFHDIDYSEDMFLDEYEDDDIANYTYEEGDIDNDY